MEIKDTILGVEKELVEKYLILVKENYRKADKATYFLERKTGISNINTITNVRDLLSHLLTLLDTSLSYEQRVAQLSTAEEHLRRSIFEPYERTVSHISLELEDLVTYYKQFILPIKENNEVFKNALNLISIESVLKEVEELRNSARRCKGRNLWDEKWEDGIKDLLDAFQLLENLKSSLEEYRNKYKSLKREEKFGRMAKRQTFLTIWGISLTIISIILGLFLFFLRK